ncbi:MAG TPA: hypothetical protein VE890_10815 [Thermoguttaceae bacterium]|nr:hypothetical protein [Thermoguttaceae bacterium]
MKHVFLILLAVVVLAGLSGCRSHCGQGLTGCLSGSCAAAPENCSSCSSCDTGPVGCNTCGGQGCQSCLGGRGQACAPGPQMGAISYPYYTVRGPRDILARNPQSIGP